MADRCWLAVRIAFLSDNESSAVAQARRKKHTNDVPSKPSSNAAPRNTVNASLPAANTELISPSERHKSPYPNRPPSGRFSAFGQYNRACRSYQRAKNQGVLRHNQRIRRYLGANAASHPGTETDHSRAGTAQPSASINDQSAKQGNEHRRAARKACKTRYTTAVFIVFLVDSAMSLSPDLRSRIESLLHAHRIVLFMKGEPESPRCGFSAKAVEILDDLEVDYTAIDILADSALREGIKLYGDWPTIPQLYIETALVGGCDIMVQLYQSGELHRILNVPLPDRTPPQITITPLAARQLQQALHHASNSALGMTIDRRFQANFQIVPYDANAIASESRGIRLQFDAASARRARGIVIDWVDDLTGRGLKVTNPNAPPMVEEISARDALTRITAGELTLIDVRGADEQAIASVPVPYHSMEDGIDAMLERFSKDTPLAFLCHFGRRSQRMAEAFQARGFSKVFNISGGIDAWSEQVDATIPRYHTQDNDATRAQ